MKKLSKIISGVCAMALATCVGTTAFAAEFSGSAVQSEGGIATADVKVSTEDATEAAKSYYVTLEYSNLTFTYDYGDITWDHDLLMNTTLNAGWKDQVNSATITATNKSNIAVTCAFLYTAEGDQSWATGSFSNDGITEENGSWDGVGNKLKLNTAAKDGGTAKGKETTGEVKFVIDSIPTQKLVDTKVGQISVTVNETVD